MIGDPSRLVIRARSQPPDGGRAGAPPRALDRYPALEDQITYVV